MTDYQNFSYGGTHYPLASSSEWTLLKDADPALFYMLEFYAAVLRTHLEPRFLAETAAAGATKLTSIVAETVPLNPEAYLTAEQFRFPLLCAYRQRTNFDYEGQSKVAIDTFEVSYVLPPLTPGAAERLSPILYAASSVLDNRTERGFDPAYKPTDADNLGDPVWEIAGVARAEVKSVKYGGFGLTEKLFFPAVMLTVELQSISKLDDSTTFLPFTRADVQVDLPVPNETTLEKVVEFQVDVEP